MSSQFRPLLAGIAVILICILLACLNWILVLCAFVAASLGFAVWSLCRQTRPNQAKIEAEDLSLRRRRRNRERSSARRRRALRNGNVYQFPFRECADDSDFSEVAD